MRSLAKFQLLTAAAAQRLIRAFNSLFASTRRWLREPLEVSRIQALIIVFIFPFAVFLAWFYARQGDWSVPAPATIAIIALTLSTVLSILAFGFQAWIKSRELLYTILSSLAALRPDIETVLRIDSKNTSDWSEDQKRAALEVCSKFHLVAWLVRKKMLPERTLATVWFYSIPQCYDILLPFIMEKRRERGSDYWLSIDRLVLRVIDLTLHDHFASSFPHAELERKLAEWLAKKGRKTSAKPTSPEMLAPLEFHK